MNNRTVGLNKIADVNNKPLIIYFLENIKK